MKLRTMKVTRIFVEIYLLQNIIFVACTDRPIIGILAQEFSEGENYLYAPNFSYIAASYVKAIESSGARVVPIFIKKTEQYYRSLLKSINGVLLPGGTANLQPGYGYYDATTTIYKIVEEMNNNGSYIPIFGVCLGFEALLTITNNHTDIQTSCTATHQNFPLNFRRNYKSSLLYSNIPSDIFIYLRYLDVTKNNHKFCTTPYNFSRSLLPRNWLVTTDNITKRGIKFISSVEHRKYPFFAVQFHPEKLFEWKPAQNNPHNPIAIKANRYFYDFFVQQASLNFNVFENKEEEASSLIYNYSPTYENIESAFFCQRYIFK